MTDEVIAIDAEVLREFMYRLGQAYLACGEQTAEVERLLRRTATAFGMRRARVVAFPTAVFITLHDGHAHRVTLAEGLSHGLRLDQIADIYALCNAAERAEVMPAGPSLDHLVDEWTSTDTTPSSGAFTPARPPSRRTGRRYPRGHVLRCVRGPASCCKLDGLSSGGVRFQIIRILTIMETAELDTSEIELRERGQLTLPKSLRDALHLETGDALRAVRIANAIVLTPQRLDLDALRKQMRKLMKQHGVSVQELLRDL